MEALREVTEWKDGGVNHIYLLDGSNLVAYIRFGTDKPFYFKNPIKGFDRRGRKFIKVNPNPFKKIKSDNRIKIEGSKGNTYYVNPEEGSCTCPGYTFRGACKHITQALAKA